MKKYRATTYLRYLTLVFVLTTLGVLTFQLPCFAVTAKVTAKLNSLYTLVVTIIKSIGSIALAMGVFEFASSYFNHESASMNQAIKKVVGGILMCGASLLISMLKI